jgi:hypothetical protein
MLLELSSGEGGLINEVVGFRFVVVAIFTLNSNLITIFSQMLRQLRQRHLVIAHRITEAADLHPRAFLDMLLQLQISKYFHFRPLGAPMA